MPLRGARCEAGAFEVPGEGFLLLEHRAGGIVFAHVMHGRSRRGGEEVADHGGLSLVPAAAREIGQRE